MDSHQELLLTNAVVLTIDKKMQVFSPGAVVVKGADIVAVGLSAELEAEYASLPRFDCQMKVLMPGLINAHTHVPMTLLRGLADDLRLDVWLLGYMMPVERAFVSSEFVKLGTKLACAEQIRSGVTCFADMYYYEDDVAEATVEAGMRAVLGETILKFPSPDSSSYEEALEYTRNFIRKWVGHPLIVPSIAPHAPYTTTDLILQQCSEIAREFDVPLQIHIAETASEVENMRKQRGMPVVPYVKKQDVLEAKVIAAHCVHIDEGEMRTFQHADSGLVHNPSSNLKLASGFAEVSKWEDLGLRVGIGTDGPSSNNDLDMFEEIRLAAFLGKNVSGNPTALPARTVTRMATRGGAEALHIEHITGSLEPGKRADLILVDLSPLHNSPQFDRDNDNIYSRLIYAAKATDVTDVMVNGAWLMRDRELLTLNEHELIADAQTVAYQIDAFLADRENSVLSKLIAIGGASEEESFEVQIKVPIDDPKKIMARITSDDEITIIRKRHYRQYDTYFSFADPEQGRIRYREDHFVDDSGDVSQVRSRLTHLGVQREQELPGQVFLSRSRYLAPATQSLRFYREYFMPQSDFEVEKERFRYLVNFNGIEFFINVDLVSVPLEGKFLEIKTRTWSGKDAEIKARVANDLLDHLGLPHDEAINADYVDMAKAKGLTD